MVRLALHRKKLRRLSPAVLALVACAILFAGVAHADTRGKMTGRIVDQGNDPVMGANVVLVGTTIGGTTGLDGSYTILNIPPGTYDVRYSAVGYQTRVLKGVKISSGQTTTENITIAESAIETGEVVTVAERPLVDTRQTSSVAILGREDIQALPVQNVADVVNLQAGVVDGHFRGGRLGEVQFQVERTKSPQKSR